MKSFSDSGYIMLKTLGQGRHGMMKLARRKAPKSQSLQVPGGQHKSEQLVAVRLIQRFALQRDIKAKEEMLSTRESHATLMKTVHCLRELDHPNVQKELETFEDKQQIFIVLQLYTGGELLDRHDQSLSEHEAAWVIDQIVAAMAHTHGKGIVHQDLRPENVRYATKEEDSRVVVTDWCCCEYLASPPDGSRRGLIFSDYSAPELEPQRRTDRSDMWSIGVMAFALLRFALPFGAHGPRPEAGDFAWLPGDGRPPSADCLSFLQALLRADPSERMSAQEALSHPWLGLARQRHAEQSGSGRGLSKSMSCAIARFRTKGSLYRLAYALAVEHLGGEELRQLTETFTMLDKDGDGTIEAGDMVKALHDNLVKPAGKFADEADEELAELFDDSVRIDALVTLMDIDGDGKIGYSEFLAAAADAALQESGAAAWEVFRTFDIDGDGIITQAEMEKLLGYPAIGKAMDVHFQASITHEVSRDKDLEKAFSVVGGSPKDSKQMFEMLDKDGDKQVTFEEFAKLIFS